MNFIIRLLAGRPVAAFAGAAFLRAIVNLLRGGSALKPTRPSLSSHASRGSARTWLAAGLSRVANPRSSHARPAPLVGDGVVASQACRHDPQVRGATSPARPAAGLLVLTLLLGACNKAPSDVSAPMTMPAPARSTPATVGGRDPSVPDASSVLGPGTAPKADAAAGRTNSTMTPGQESGAMPLPGQNNDHSAPQAPARRASGA